MIKVAQRQALLGSSVLLGNDVKKVRAQRGQVTA